MLKLAKRKQEMAKKRGDYCSASNFEGLHFFIPLSAIKQHLIQLQLNFSWYKTTNY